MRVFAVDSSGDSGSVALCEEGAFERERLLLARGSSRESLGHLARALLLEARWRPGEIDLIVAGIGPGSYTGIRMAVTFAKTLAYALKRPLVGLSGLMAIARDADQPGRCIGVLEAGHRTRFYGAAYRFVHGLGEEVLPVGLWEPKAFFEAIPSGTLLTGTQVRLMEDEINARGHNLAPMPVAPRVRALTLARLGSAHFLAGRPTTDAHDLEPLYLQLSAPERPDH